MLAHDPLGMADLVFGALDRANERVLAASDQQHEPLFRPIEGRHQLGAVLHGQPPRRAGPGIDEASAITDPRLHGGGGALERATGRAHRPDRRELPLDQGVQNVAFRPQIEAGVTGANAFSFHRI